MPEPLKNLYTSELIQTVCTKISECLTRFDATGFTEYVFDGDWDSRELKDRMIHIATGLRRFLPRDYAEALQVIKQVAPEFRGFEYMFFPGFVELYGLDDFDESVSVLELVTEFSTSEAAVRPFIIKYPEQMMAQMEKWAESPNHHVRRLATEGCRPRLPWAMALLDFKKDPSAVLVILEKLKADESEFVRRSVANNLNDIAKDNPDIAIETAQRWFGVSKETDWVVKHGCRTLLKQGVPEIMELFGLGKPDYVRVKDFHVQPEVALGDELAFSFTLVSERELGKLRIEYGVDYMKKNGSLARKIFKVSESYSSGKEKCVTKTRSFKKISTRKYYTGQHRLAIICNGHELACKDFVLTE